MMFVITDTTSDIHKGTVTNNSRDVYDIVLNITNDKQKAMVGCYATYFMGFDDTMEFDGYTLACVKDSEILDS